MTVAIDDTICPLNCGIFVLRSVNGHPRPMMRVDPPTRTPHRDHHQPNCPIDEATARGWLGDADGLKISLEAAQAKMAWP
ncbi:hypothetical protein ETD83_18080 [Actinomadura soli]|uniref:Uncharacterized protein n=1 Tax=Actinomadura soli TaxID=2508997 RepID=A0A5C4JAJ8_9ACTN|nr:hypothetical protein [Actinomadura soli]TMQ99261.1 hypothetical protein ETD83_18080 [Actinomadura soli]